MIARLTVPCPFGPVSSFGTEVLETVSGGDPKAAVLAQNIRADVAETRAIREAQRQRLLQEFRDEAAAARRSR